MQNDCFVFPIAEEQQNAKWPWIYKTKNTTSLLGIHMSHEIQPCNLLPQNILEPQSANWLKIRQLKGRKEDLLNTLNTR